MGYLLQENKLATSGTDSINEIRLVRTNMTNTETGGNQVRKINEILNQSELEW